MINRLALALALLMPITIEGGLLAEVIPEVLVAQQKSGLDDIERLSKEVEQAEEASN